jgi:PKD repeat protein
MSSEACQSVPASWKAYLEIKFKGTIDDDGSDRFRIDAISQSGGAWGWSFYGNWSDWYTLVFNLRQWYALGDLGENYCNTLRLGFVSDNISSSGYGARVDDLYVSYGNTVGTSECAIIADPATGQAPLTVAFRGVTDISAPSFDWRFGDGQTSTARDPVHVFTSAGTYDTSVVTYNDYGTRCFSTQTITVTPGSCSYQISPTSATIYSSGGSQSFSLSTTSNCSWTASSDASWLTIANGTSGTGSKTITYSAAANTTTSQRTGHITAGGRTFTLTQEAAPVCAYFISPTSRSHPSESETGTISVNSATGCAWTASTSTGWIHITSGSSGSGNGTVVYRVDANSSTSQRSGTILAAGRTFTVTQSGVASCSYTISPTSQSFGPSAGTGSVTVSTTSGCSWSASSSAAWVSITSGNSGSGGGTVSYMVSANTSTSSRSTSLTIAGRQFSISQSGTSGGGGGDHSYLVAGIAHAPGAGGSSWRSTLAVTNPSSQPANLTLTYQFGGITATRTIILSGDAIREWDDVASSLFGQSGSTSGSIRVESNLPLLVTARTYNATLGGTFGQYLPGAESTTAIASGQMGVLPQIKKVSGYRTNVGFINLGSSAITIQTRLFSEDGFPLGNPIATTVAATEWKQINDVFATAGINQCSVGFATVELTSGAGPFWAYASVVDNASGDPTTIPVFVN